MEHNSCSGGGCRGLGEVSKELSKMSTQLAVYNSHLEHFMERIEKVEDTIKPIQKHVDRVASIFWFLTSLIGILVALKSFIK
jgi:archaellum component FlaC